MTVALDTNVLVDAIADRNDFESCQKLILAVAEDRLTGVISANSITDIYYILRKRIGEARARQAIWNLLSVFDVAEIDAEVCSTALGTQMRDFENAVLAVSALQLGAEFIVTNDREFIEETETPVKAISVYEALETP